MSTRSPFSHPLPWIAVVAGAVLAAVMTFAYLGAFVAPVEELDGLPVGYVVEDRAVTVADTEIAVGALIGEQLAAQQDGPVEWIEFESRADALAEVADNRLAGVLILPAQLSQQVADIGTSLGKAPAATIDVVDNPGSGSLQPAVVARATATVVAEANAAVAAQLSGALTTIGATVAPDDVGSLAVPITTRTTSFPALGDRGGRGLPPLYVAVMATLTGLVGAIAIHTALDSLSGREHIDLLGRRLRFPRLEVGPIGQFLHEALLVGALALLSGPVIALVAVGAIGAEADEPVLIGAICILGVATIGWLTLLCVTAFGVVGEVLVVLVTTIFGVPSSRGVYPAEALPPFFVAIGEVLPMRHLTDALRSAFYFGGRADAGRVSGAAALTAWAVVSLLLGVAAAALVASRRASGEPTDTVVVVDAAPVAGVTRSS